jgi:hypothetical protein
MSSSSLDRIAASRSIVFIELGELVENLLPLEAGQPLQLHVEDRLRLDLVRPNCGDQAVRASTGFFDAADERDDRVEMIERDLQPFEDVGSRFGLAQLELDAPPHDLAAELDEVLDDLEQASTRGPAGTMASSVMP